MSKNKKLSIKSNIIFNSIGTSIYLACQWMLTVVIVRVLGYDIMGYYSLAMSYTTLYCIIASFNMRNYQVSDIKSKFNDEIYIATRIITCIISFAICVTVLFFNNYNIEQKVIIVLYMAYKVSEVLLDVYHGIFQKKWRMDIISYSYASRGVVELIVFSIVVYVTKSMIIGIVALIVCTIFLGLLIDIRFAYKNATIFPNFVFREIKSLLLDCLPLMIANLLTNAAIVFPRIILENEYNSAILGIFTSVAMPTMIIQTIAGFIITPLITLLAEHYSRNDLKTMHNVLLKCFFAISIISIVALIGAKILGNWGLELLYGNSILAYNYLLIPMVFTAILTSAQVFVYSVNIVMRDSTAMLLSTSVGLAISLLISSYTIKRYCMIGANTVLIISLAIQIIIGLYFIFKRIKGRDK